MAISKKVNYKCPSCGYHVSSILNLEERELMKTTSCLKCKSSTYDEVPLSSLSVRSFNELSGGLDEDVAIGAPLIVSGVGLHGKVPTGFKEILEKVRHHHPHHKIDGELSH